MDGSKGSNEWFQRVMAYCDNGNQTVTVTACKTTYSWIISKKIELNCCCKDIICEVFNGFSFIIIHRTPYIFIRTTYEYRVSCTRNVFLDQTSVHNYIIYVCKRSRLFQAKFVFVSISVILKGLCFVWYTSVWLAFSFGSGHSWWQKRIKSDYQYVGFLYLVTHLVLHCLT